MTVAANGMKYEKIGTSEMVAAEEGKKMKIRKAALVGICLLALSGGLLGGCSAEPSSPKAVAAYCKVLKKSNKNLQKIFAEWQKSPKNGSSDSEKLIASILSSSKNIVEFQKVVADIEAAAPNEIRSDVETIKRLIDKASELTADSLNDPLGIATKMGTDLLFAYSAVSNWESYTKEHCGNVFG